MSRSELSLFSYEILALVGHEGAAPHDLLRMAQRGRILDWAGESQYYVEPKRLARLGYLETRQEPGRGRPRTVYSLTGSGLDALKAYAATPVTFTPVKSEPLLRLLLADLVGEQAVRDSYATLRDDLEDLRRRLDESAEAAEQLPHRRKYLLIANRHLHRLVDLHEQLADEIERELSG